MGDVEQLTIGPDSEVTMTFSLMLTDGTVVEQTEEGEPMTFRMGDGTLVHGLELSLYGLKEGDHQSLEIDPLNAFGFPDEENIHPVPRDEFAPELPLDEGTILSFSIPSGEEIPGMIREVKENEVMVDFNHPLAGRNVIFEVDILGIK